MSKLSKKALEILRALFAENSGLQLPVGVVKEIIEIKEWVEKELRELEKENKI
jgi:hypothetical protein